MTSQYQESGLNDSQFANMADFDYVEEPRRSFLPAAVVFVAGLLVTWAAYELFRERDVAPVNERTRDGLSTLVSLSSLEFENPTLEEVTRALTDIQDTIESGSELSVALVEDHIWAESFFGLETTSILFLQKVMPEDVDNLVIPSNVLGEAPAQPIEIELTGRDGLPVPMNREAYFPSVFQYGYAELNTIGMDWSADPTSLLAMEQARDTGLVTSRTSFPLASEAEPLLLAHYYLAVYTPGSQPSTIEERRDNHIGYLAAISAIPAADIVDFLPQDYLGLEVAFFTDTPAFSSDALNPELATALNSGEILENSYALNGVPSRVAVRASDKLIEDLRGNERWWALGIGLLMTCWLSSWLLSTRLKSARVVELVNERTHHLAERTQSLAKAYSDLSQSERRYKLLSNNVTDVIYTHDEKGKFTFVSHSSVHQTGYEPDQLVGTSLFEYLNEQDAVYFERKIKESIDQVKQGLKSDIANTPYEFQFFCKDGTKQWMELQEAPLTENDGSLSEFLGVMRNINVRKKSEQEKKELEAAYSQSQKMEAIGTLAGGVAHDFNNLLTGIMGNIDILKMEGVDKQEAEESIEIIENAANRAKQLTNQLLGFSRQGNFQTIPVNINSILSEIATLIGRTIDKRIQVIKNPSSENPVVIGDPGQISQIFLNLAVNARDAMPDGGTLTFTSNIVNLDEGYCQKNPEATPGKYCNISVADTGTGISADKLEKIFEPFYTDKEEGKGTGLGLAMVYGVTKSHGGLLTVESTFGEGTVFNIYLPLSTEKVEDSKQPNNEVLIDGKGHILFVDDEAMIRKIANRMIPRMGFEVTVVEDGHEAIEEYSKNWQDYDLVMMDMIMPKMNGIECLAELRKINPQLRAILLSGFSKDSISEELNQSYVLGFLKKPFRMGDLSQVLSDVLSKSK